MSHLGSPSPVGLRSSLQEHWDAVVALFQPVSSSSTDSVDSDTAPTPLACNPSISPSYDNLSPVLALELSQSPVAAPFQDTSHPLWSLPLPEYPGSVLEEDLCLQVNDHILLTMSPFVLTLLPHVSVRLDPGFPNSIFIGTNSAHGAKNVFLTVTFSAPLRLFVSSFPSESLSFNTPYFAARTVEKVLFLLQLPAPCFQIGRRKQNLCSLGEPLL